METKFSNLEGATEFLTGKGLRLHHYESHNEDEIREYWGEFKDGSEDEDFIHSATITYGEGNSAIVKTFEREEEEMIEEVNEEVREFIESITWQIAFQKRTSASALANFRTEFEKDPFSAFNWSEGALRAAANLKVAKEAEAALKDVKTEEDIETFQKAFRDEVMTKAAESSSSTYPVINEMNRAYLRALANMAEWAGSEG